jgi:hypothetical protein
MPSAQKQEKEIGFIGKALRGLGALGGGTLGAMIGAPSAGSTAGSSLGAAVSKWLGAGDYIVSANSTMKRAANGIPVMHNSGQTVVVRHREFVTELSGSTAFTVQKSLTINPGLVATFPWLANIAGRFQEYEVKGMVWHYVPTSGTFNGTTAALGSVMIQTTYRSTDSAPASKQELLNEYWSNEVVPFETMAHPIECDPKENPFSVHYVRNEAIVTGEPLMYDLGTTFVATSGMSPTAVVGDLWVTYEIELRKPVISSPVIQTLKYYATTFASPTTSSFFAGTQGAVVGSIPGITYGVRRINFPAGFSGSWKITCQIISAGGLTHATGLLWNGGITPTNAILVVYDGVNTQVQTTITGTNPITNQLTISSAFTVTDPSLTTTSLDFPAAVWTSGTTDVFSVVLSNIA